MDIEQRLERLERRYLTLYHRSYARNVRRVVARTAAHKRVLLQAQRLSESWAAKRRILRGAAIAAGRKPGARPVYLTEAERIKLLDWLRYDRRRGRP